MDRHLEKYRNKAAIIFVSEVEEEPPVAITYQELFVRVNEMAALLRDQCGLKTGDRVTIHMPMVAELPITMLACARLGVIHSVVFGGFSGEACGTRIVDSGSRVLITMDGYYRSGKLLDHKANADIAVRKAAEEGTQIEKVLIWRRFRDKSASPTPLVEGRDFIINDLLKEFVGKRVPPVSMPAEAPLFLMYTSGSTGKPKGCQHSTGGYLAYVAGTSKYIQDIHPTDVYWCMADIGWITGHSYIVYGPLALAATSVIYEGVSDLPGRGPTLADRRALGGQHLPHVPHRHSRPSEVGTRRAEEVPLPVQEHDHGGRADRARSVEVVLRDGRPGPGGDHRHLVADRERWIPRVDQARDRPDEARERRPTDDRDLPDYLR